MQETTEKKRPKVLIFDIGGVCVVSPFKAILEYERDNNIPKGYINYAISASKPNGAWHRAERGELPLDQVWFQAFKEDLERPAVWERYHVEKLGYSSATVSSDSTTESTTATATTTATKGTKQRKIPPVSPVDAEKLYWTMMSTAQATDPHMGPALARLASHRDSLRQQQKQQQQQTPTQSQDDGQNFHIVALSNTTIFPAGHRYNEMRADDFRHAFEIFVSSAHVGMRKPNRDIYEYTMRQIRGTWPAEDIRPGDCVFLDDIGENLRTGRQMGWRTIRVLLGKSVEAVRELQAIMGVPLLLDGDEAYGQVDKAKL